MLQDSQMKRNTERITTRVLCFHLLIKRCVLILTFCYFLFMGLFSRYHPVSLCITMALRQLAESSANCNISLIPFQIRFRLRAKPPSPFSMLYRKEANSRDRKSNIEKGGGGSIVVTRKEIRLKYSNMAKCLNTFVAHCPRQ